MTQHSFPKPVFEIKRGGCNIPQTTTEVKIKKGIDKDIVFRNVEPLVNDEIKVLLSKSIIYSQATNGGNNIS